MRSDAGQSPTPRKDGFATASRPGKRAAGAGDEARHPSDRVRLWRGVLEDGHRGADGIVREDVLWNGLGSVDEEDLREWLARHGASRRPLLGRRCCGVCTT